jgi:pSer/pThr/pTyr-binding forkhead associated (FHA) protein
VSDDDLATKLFDKATAEHAELVVVAGEHKGKTVSLGAGTVVIGRGSECELPLKGAVGASRRHCKVQYLGNRFVVIDLESRNGTVVNGQSVERKVLEPNDKIEIGDEIIQFIVHRLADLGDVDDSMSSPFDETNSKTLRVPPPVPDDSFANPLVAAVDLGSPAVRVKPDAPVNLVVPVATRSSSTIPAAAVAAAPAPTTPPMPAPAQAPAPTTSRSTWIFGAASMAIAGIATVLIYDFVTTPSIDPKTIAALVVVDAGTAVAPAVPTPTPTPVAAAVDAGVVAVVDAGVAAAVADAGVAAVVDAGVAAVVDAGVAATPAAAGGSTVQATGAGRALAVKVKVGDRVAAGDVVVVVGTDPGTLPRKLEALRREEREFADAARSDPSLNGDLEQVRREIKRIQARLETKPQTATQAGVVVEVLVKEGDAVAVGAPLVRLQ